MMLASRTALLHATCLLTLALCFAWPVSAQPLRVGVVGSAPFVMREAGMGRLISGTWMVVAIILFSSLTAGIATTLTISELNTAEITSPQGLSGKRVAVVAGTQSLQKVREVGGRPLPTKHLEAAAHALAQGEVKFLVHDRPILQYYLQEHPEIPLTLSPVQFSPQYYGIALPQGSPLAARLNPPLLTLIEAGAVASILTTWIGSGP